MKQTIINLQLNKVATILKWLVLNLTACPNTRNKYSQVTYYWIGTIDDLLSRQGTKWVCDHFKEVRALTIQYLSGKKPTAKRFIKQNAKGLPRILGPLLDLVYSGDETDIKFLLTLLKVTKCLRTEPRPDITPITKEPTGSLAVLPEEVLQTFFDGANIKRGSLIPHWSEYHLSTKSSPLRGPATVKALEELVILRDNPTLLESIKTFGGNTISHYISVLINLNLPKPPVGSSLRRLLPISDKEGKTRLVAILDYWSQTVLKCFHDAVLPLLSNFQSDMTFNQESFSQGKMSGPYYCFDLKDATDRFPISLQKQVVEFMTTSAHAEAWVDMLTHYPYDLKGCQVFYKTGQPMGAYSSWAIFTLCHHLIVHYASALAGKARFKSYWILGDDIVIRNHEVAKYYQEIMNSLGVEFSPSKTIVSENFCEFASRHFRDGKEVTGFSCNGLLELKTIPELIEFWRTMVRHGWHIPHGNPPGLFMSLSKVLKIKHSFTKEQLNVLWLFPIKETLTLSTGLERASALSALSCFPKGGEILRSSLLEILEEKLETELDFVIEKSVDWAKALSHICLQLTLDSGTDGPPLPPSVVPIIGAWHVLRALANSRLREMFQQRREHQAFDLDWVASMPMLHTVPDVNLALKQRRSVLILRSNASLVLKAWKHAKKTRAEI